MAEVYWIHLPEHTDIFTEGYIGITKNTAKKRFYKHLSASKSTNHRGSTILSKAIKKYGDRIVVDTIVISSIEYAFDLEQKLRPFPRIGWNTDHGGRGRKEVSTITKKKISDSLMGHAGVVHTEETKRRMSEKRKGIPRPKDLPDKIRTTLISRGPWNKEDAVQDVWINAENLYTLFESGLGYTAAANRLNISRSKTNTVFRWFLRGWNPFLDLNWKSWKDSILFTGQDDLSSSMENT